MTTDEDAELTEELRVSRGLPAAPPGLEWRRVRPSRVRVGDLLTHRWLEDAQGRPAPGEEYDFKRAPVVDITAPGTHPSRIVCPKGRGVWGTDTAFNLNPGDDGRFWFIVLRPPAANRSRFPHQCPRCARPAYLGLLEVEHADEAAARACPARRALSVAAMSREGVP